MGIPGPEWWVTRILSWVSVDVTDVGKVLLRRWNDDSLQYSERVSGVFEDISPGGFSWLVERSRNLFVAGGRCGRGRLSWGGAGAVNNFQRGVQNLGTNESRMHGGREWKEIYTHLGWCK